LDELLGQDQLQHTRDEELSEVDVDALKRIAGEKVKDVIEAVGGQRVRSATEELSSGGGSNLETKAEDGSIKGSLDPVTSSNGHITSSGKRTASLVRSSIPELRPSSSNDDSPRSKSPNPQRSSTRRSKIPKLLSNIRSS